MSAATPSASDPAPAKLPWAYQSLLRFGTLILVSLAVLITAWIGSTHRGTLPRQNIWLLVGLAALAVLVTAATRWLLEGLRNVRHRQNLVAMRLERVVDAVLQDPEAVTPVTRPTVASGAVVAVPGLGRYHRPSCPLIANKAAVSVSTAERAKQALRPCGVCLP